MKKIILLSLLTVAWSFLGCGDDDGDTTSNDAGSRDSGARDSGARDSGLDASATDSGPADAGPPGQPMNVGDVVITEIMASENGSYVDWFEVHNPSTTVTYNLKNCGILDDVGKLATEYAFNIPIDIIIPPGGYVTFSEGTAEQAGFPTNFAYLKETDAGITGAFGLSSNGENPFIMCGDTIIDNVNYKDSSFDKNPGVDGGMPSVHRGYSYSLDPAYIDSATANNNGSYWCNLPTDDLYNYTKGPANDAGIDAGTHPANYGTPGAPNPPCPQ